MRLPNPLVALLLAAPPIIAHEAASPSSATLTVPIFIQPITVPETAPSLLAEISYGVPDQSSHHHHQHTTTGSAADSTLPGGGAAGSSNDGPETFPAEVASYEAPDLPAHEGARPLLVRIGAYDAAAGRWASSTSAASAAAFAKGYSPHFVLSVVTVAGAPERERHQQQQQQQEEVVVVVGVSCKGIRIDAGQTRDFGPQAVMVASAPGRQPDLNRDVVLSAEGKMVGPEEKTFLQKYWWVLVIGMFLLMSGTGDGK